MRTVTYGTVGLASLLLFTLASSGCRGGSAGSGGEGFAVRDSSGVRIVEADWDRMSVLDTVVAEPLFTVGAREDVALNRVRAGRLLPGGRIAVGHGATPEVIVVDTASGEVTTVATAGDGPEELGSVAGLHLEDGGERIGVYDPGRRRYLVFEPDGRLAEERSLRDVWPGRGGPAVEMWGPPTFLPAEEGVLFMGAQADVPETDGAFRAEFPLLRVRESGVDTVTRYRGREFLRDGQNVGPVLLGARVVFAASPAGVWVGDTDLPAAARWSEPGAPELIVRWTRDLDRSPAYGDLLVDDRGLLWVGEHYGADNPQIRDLPDERREWALFDPDGTPRGRVVTPPRLEVLDVRSGRLLGVHRDELGVETVRAYPVER